MKLHHHGEPSDPYLMTGFDQKCIHLSHDANKSVNFTIEVDFMGHGVFKPYLVIASGEADYAQHTFPQGFSTHWLRVVSDTTCIATAQLHYT